MTGTISKRGKASWRVKYDLPRDENGQRRTAYVTVKGTRKDAEKELRAKLSTIDAGTHVDPSKLTVGEYLDNWLDKAAPLTAGTRTVERYRVFVRLQIKPHLGTVKLQDLKPRHIREWHQALIDEGKVGLRTLANAHGALRTALARAVTDEVLARNVARIAKPPKWETAEVAILTKDQIADVLDKLAGHPLYPIVATAIGTGARRGEIAALTWGAVDLDAGTMTIRQALEQTKKHGIRVKAPKTKAGRRTIGLPAVTVAALREHRLKTLELRLALGAGALRDDTPVFATLEGEWPSLMAISTQWQHAVKSLGLPKITFHALRHCHASALIAAGLDVVTVSRRLGHSKASITLDVYAHLFTNNDAAAVDAIDAIL